MRKIWKTYFLVGIIYILLLEINYALNVDFFRSDIAFGLALNLLNDRFFILCVNGITLLLVCRVLVFDKEHNSFFRIRIGSYFRYVLYTEKRILLHCLCINAIRIVIILLMTVVLYGADFALSLTETALLLSVAINTYLFTVLAANLFFWMTQLGCKDTLAAGIMIVAYLTNLSLSGNPNFLSYPKGRASWIGHVMCMDLHNYRIYFAYWMMQLLVVFGLLCLKNVIIPSRWMRRHAGAARRILTAVTVVIIFAVYGYVMRVFMDLSGSPPSDLANYFIGFKRIDIFLFGYLFYQLPVWIYVYATAREYVKVMGFQYLLRKGGVRQLMRRLAGRELTVICMYYLTGAAVLSVCGRLFAQGEQGLTVGAADMTALLLNVIAQMCLLCMLSFLLWMHDKWDMHFGVVVVLALHLMLTGLGFAHPLSARLLPFSGGIYWLNRDAQWEVLVFQLGWIIVLGLLIYLPKGHYNRLLQKKI